MFLLGEIFVTAFHKRTAGVTLLAEVIRYVVLAGSLVQCTWPLNEDYSHNMKSTLERHWEGGGCWKTTGGR